MRDLVGVGEKYPSNPEPQAVWVLLEHLLIPRTRDGRPLKEQYHWFLRTTLLPMTGSLLWTPFSGHFKEQDTFYRANLQKHIKHIKMQFQTPWNSSRAIRHHHHSSQRAPWPDTRYPEVINTQWLQGRQQTPIPWPIYASSKSLAPLNPLYLHWTGF